jgi:hypothetical protein
MQPPPWAVWADSVEQPPLHAGAAPHFRLRIRDSNAVQKQQEAAATARETVSCAEPAAVESAEGARADSGVVDPPGSNSCDASADQWDPAIMHDGMFSHEGPFNDNDCDLDDAPKLKSSPSVPFFQQVQRGLALHEESA